MKAMRTRAIKGASFVPGGKQMKPESDVKRPASTSASSVAQLIQSPLGWHVFFLLLIALTFLPRINSKPEGDATTSFLMNSDVAAVHVPYCPLLDNKPPLFFLMVGGSMSCFKETIFRSMALRCDLHLDYGDHHILGMSVRCTVAGRDGRWVCSRCEPKLFSGNLLIEHLAVAFLIASLWLVLAHREKPSIPFLVAFYIHFRR